ncbi:hypothetical protein ACFYN5_00760 [Streptomyces sp. NPDC007126]|uniref:hypothetical protein n=1 Tax=unclassified Streptomyces TaxID=2593676 RepID=UPI001F609E9F|nr:hypothetical protein [Streptomyces sp. KO7888]
MSRSSTQWLTALDHAEGYGLVLWCDDRVLRTVARSEGVAAFGTVALLDARVKADLTTPGEALLTKAELLRNHYVDIPFSADLYHAAALADGWQAKAVAVALSLPAAWADAKAASAFALDAASRAVSTLPHEATGWISAAYGGLHRAMPPRTGSATSRRSRCRSSCSPGSRRPPFPSHGRRYAPVSKPQATAMLRWKRHLPSIIGP